MFTLYSELISGLTPFYWTVRFNPSSYCGLTPYSVLAVRFNPVYFGLTQYSELELRFDPAYSGSQLELRFNPVDHLEFRAVSTRQICLRIVV